VVDGLVATAAGKRRMVEAGVAEVCSRSRSRTFPPFQLLEKIPYLGRTLGAVLLGRRTCWWRSGKDPTNPWARDLAGAAAVPPDLVAHVNRRPPRKLHVVRFLHPQRRWPSTPRSRFRPNGPLCADGSKILKRSEPSCKALDPGLVPSDDHAVCGSSRAGTGRAFVTSTPAGNAFLAPFSASGPRTSL